MAEEQSEQQILADLTHRAEQLWGSERAAALRVQLQDTARQLAEIRRNLPPAEVEPGFFL